MNKYTGEVPLQIGTVKGKLEFTWRALAEVKSEFPQEKLDNVFALKPDELAKIAAIGFQKHSPLITADMIMDASPALAAVAKAVDNALVLAYYGPEDGRKAIKAVDDMNAELAKVKKNAAESKKKTR